MSWDKDLESFARKVEQMQRDIFVSCTMFLHESITKGSDLTGAPGQPVDTGNLINSWQITFPSATVSQVATNVAYAPNIEDGIGRGGRPMTLRSEVGGFHSVKRTRAAWPRVVQKVTADTRAAYGVR